MNSTEMTAWSNVCDATPAEEGVPFDAVALVVETGVPHDAALAMVNGWASHGGHRVVPAADGLSMWDFGPDNQGYPDALAA